MVRPEDALQSVRTAIMLGAVLPDMRVQAEALAADLADLVRIRKEIADEKDRLVRDVAALTEERQRIAPADRGAAEKAGRDREGAGGRAAEVARAGPPGGQSQRFDRQGRAGPRQRQPRRAGGRTRRRGPRTSRIDLAALNDPGRLTPAVAFASARGQLPLPVNGARIKEFGAPDSLGGTEKGISIATRAACPGHGALRRLGGLCRTLPQLRPSLDP